MSLGTNIIILLSEAGAEGPRGAGRPQHQLRLRPQQQAGGQGGGGGRPAVDLLDHLWEVIRRLNWVLFRSSNLHYNSFRLMMSIIDSKGFRLNSVVV